MRRRWLAAAAALGAIACLAWPGDDATPARSPAPPARQITRAPALAAHAPAPAPASQRALVAQVAGLTRDELFGGIATGGTMPGLPQWLWRASGLVTLDPALAAEVGAQIANRRITGRAAELALDVLAAAGTPEAQAAMRVALAAPGPGAGRLVQRFSLVTEPTAETARWLGERYAREADPATAHALGAVVRAAGRGDAAARAQAATWNARLVGDLAVAPTARRQTELLGAIGNAGAAANVPAVIALAHSDDPGVRAGVAHALRHTDTPAARTEVLSLVTDAAAPVQHAALDTLARWPLTGDDIAALTARVTASGVRDGNQGVLIDLAAGRMSADAVPLLEAIAAAPSTFATDRTRIAELLHRLRTSG